MRSRTPKARAGFGMVLAMGLTIQAWPALAHHSFAAYDVTQVMTAKGTIKEFFWSAPHCALLITIQQSDGTTKDLLLISSAPTLFARQGFDPKSFHPGDKVEVTWNPNRNGSDGGSIATLTLPDGRVYRQTEFAPPPSQPPSQQPPPSTPQTQPPPQQSK